MLTNRTAMVAIFSYRHSIALEVTFHSMKRDATPLVYTGPRSVGAQAAL